jgi:uncharacterized membrane protein
MKNIILLLLISLMVLSLVPLQANALSLVPCGRSGLPGEPGTEPCQFEHIVVLVVRMINYLITVAAVVAMYQVLLSGFNMIVALGNPEKLKSAREGLSHAVVGFALIILAFVMVNLLVNGIFGTPGSPRNWWNPDCIYDITDTEGCPIDP